ncbi:histidine phosphatase family protein [Undibacterium sp. CY7W]|uniref:Histidine phosphatase family protein n=1 Tax=Undibacterium rugosum TaxID=2762291 RepID=A0A923I3Z0_9BURK|nr:histidine phosphatase family protein [Undibacterium rugosum]MBC3936707.1 histidine phosphatase family protein [Undibacterium rugosum]
MKLIVIRHLAPLQGEGLCYGHTDLAVDAQANAQAAASLRASLPSFPVFSSPLQRCLSLASLLGRTVQTDDRLRELNFGDWEMQPWDRIDRADIDAWAADTVYYRPGGAESLLQMTTRVSAFLRTLQAQNLEGVILITHAGVLKILSQWEAAASDVDIAQRVASRDMRFSYGSCTQLDILM